MVAFLYLGVKIVNAGQGCCSYHGGESGYCSNGSEVCRDGQLSPTCGCYSATPVKTYWWGFQSFTDYNAYYKARWDGIQEMYQQNLGRGFYSQDEGKLYSDTDKTKFEIQSEIVASPEHQEYLKKIAIKQQPVVIQPTSNQATQQNNSTDYTWWYIIGGVVVLYGGGVIYNWYSERKK